MNKLDYTLGAYVEYPSQYFTLERIKISCCGVSYTENDKFCSKCGSELVAEKVSGKFTTHISDLIDKDDEFIQIDREGITYLYSNYSSVGIVNFCEYEDGVSYINQELIDDCICSFANYYRDDLKLLTSKLGIELEVKFGLIRKW